jgi:plastocyanin
MSNFSKQLGIVVVLLALATFALVLCVPTSTPTTAGLKPVIRQAAASVPIQVEIKLFTFKPQSIEVPVGTTVVWTNRDAVEHTVTNGTPEKPGGAFDSGFFTQDQTFSFTFTKAGGYPYFCKRHNFMHGEIKVVPTP